MGPSLLLMTALVYLRLAGYVTKAKPDHSTKAEAAYAGPGPAALWLYVRILGGAAVDVAALYKPG